MLFYLNIACTKSKCYGRADPSSLPVKEREIDGREPMTLADINRLINSKYEANLRRNMSLTKGFHRIIRRKTKTHDMLSVNILGNNKI